MDRACHWLCHNHSSDGPYFVSFNLSNEVFLVTPIPSDCFDVKVEWINLVVLNRSIALISYHENMTTFHISILGEPNMKESWTIHFTAGPLACVGSYQSGDQGGNIFLRKR